MSYDEIINNIKKINIDFKNFSVESSEAKSLYGVSSNLISQLIDNGFPHKNLNEKILFDANDLANLSLNSGLLSVRRMAMRSWSNTLSILSRGSNDIIANIQCSIDERFKEGEELDVLTSHCSARQKIKYIEGSSIFTYQHILRCGRKVDFPTEIRDMLLEISRFQFYMLPETLRWDLSFIQENKLSECSGASRLLCYWLNQAGFRARQLFGLLVAKPFSCGHFWTEIFLDGNWYPVDALLIKLLSKVTRLNTRVWGPTSNLAGLFYPLAQIKVYRKLSGYESPVLLACENDSSDIINPIVVYNNREVLASYPTTMAIMETVIE